MKVSTKGRVTIPQKLRQRFGIEPGTEVEFIVDGNAIWVRPVLELSRGARLVEHMRGRATVKMSTDEILALTRGQD